MYDGVGVYMFVLLYACISACKRVLNSRCFISVLCHQLNLTMGIPDVEC